MLGVFGGEGADVVGGETEIPGIGGGGGGAEPGIGDATPAGIAGGLLNV